MGVCWKERRGSRMWPASASHTVHRGVTGMTKEKPFLGQLPLGGCVLCRCVHQWDPEKSTVFLVAYFVALIKYLTKGSLGEKGLF